MQLEYIQDRMRGDKVEKGTSIIGDFLCVCFQNGRGETEKYVKGYVGLWVEFCKRGDKRSYLYTGRDE